MKTQANFKAIVDVLRYFSNFNYPPTFAEIYTFLKKKTSLGRLASILKKMEKENLIKGLKLEVRRKKLEVTTKDKRFVSSNFQLRPSNNLIRYTLPEYSNKIKDQRSKIKASLEKIKRIALYIKLLTFFPQIKLAGLSGSLAMLNATEEHDVDLFIITAKNRLWTARFIALLLAQLLGVRRKRTTNYELPTMNYFKNKVCLNLFFDQTDLSVPKFKQSEYVAHEVLQMKPLVQKDDIYWRFIDANRWVSEIFPNSISKIKDQKSKRQTKVKKFLNLAFLDFIFDILYLIFDFIQGYIEFILSKLQLTLIERHRTNELISNTQLWFHPVRRGSTRRILERK